MRNITELMDQVDALIRAGKYPDAKTLLGRVPLSKVPERFQARFASLARRMNQPQVALRLLGPGIRPYNDRRLGGTVEMQAEYSAALIKIGATTESLDILQSMQNPPPVALLYKAFAHIALWDYQKAIPILEEYSASPGLTYYEKLLGLANTVAALVHEESFKAKPLLETLLEETKGQNFAQLHGQARKLKAQWYVAMRDFERARTEIKLAGQVLNGMGGVDFLFIQKWSAIIDILESGGSTKALVSLEEAKKSAIKNRHWETVRDCDFYKAICLHDKKLFIKLYFGTPFAAFRSRILSKYGENVALPDHYLLRNDTDLNPKKITNVFNQVKKGQLQHRMLSVLASDFYRPFSVGSLFSQVYAGELFNAKSSHTKIYQSVKRLKQWLYENSIPIKIVETGGSYSMKIKENYGLLVPQDKVPGERKSLLLDDIKKHFQNVSFTTLQASEAIKENHWTVLRVLQEGVKNGFLARIGNKSSAQYQFQDVVERLPRANLPGRNK